MSNKVSIKTVLNTPQAVNDALTALEDLVAYLNVLANDGGGSAASLYALLEAGSTAQQIASELQAPVRTAYVTSLGAVASIVSTGDNAGTIAYDASALDYLAEGQTATDTFSYVIQLGNGTFSIATVTVTVTGSNDRPTVGEVTVGAAAGVVEDGPVYRGGFAGDDIDSDDGPASLVYQIVSQPGPGEGSVSVDPDNSAGFIFDPGADFQDLEEGETRTVTFTYQAVDRHGAVSEPGTVTITVTGTADATSGSAIDGYIANALVFRDSNNNSAWDHEAFTDANGNGLYDDGEAYVDADSNGVFNSEYFTVTDGQGNFTGLGGIGRIVMTSLVGTGGNLTTDISTGQAWEGLYSAPAGSSVVTPLTTLLDSLAGPNASAQDISDAKAVLAGALGIDPSVDLGSFDPLAAVVGETDPAALALAVTVQKIAVQVANIIAVIDGTLQAAGVEDGGALAATALAAAIEGSGGGTDLTSATLIESVIEDAAAASGDPGAQAAVGEQSGAIAEALSGINEVIDNVDATGDPLGALAEVVAAQIVAQDNLTEDAASAVTGGAPVDSGTYEGTSLVEQLDEAANEVETIIPEDNTGSPLGAPERPAVDDGIRINSAEIADGIVVTVAYAASTGVAAGDKLNLLLGGTVIASYTLTAGDIPASGTLTHAFAVAAAALGADGAKVLTAQFETQAGEAGPASPPALVTVDTSAPGAPAAIVAVEGAIVTSVEAADGTQFTGAVDAGSIVTFTFANGASVLVKEAAVTDGNFTLTLAATEIAGLGEGHVSYSAVASDAAGNQSAASATGQFFYTTQAVVDGTSRVDGAGSYFAGDTDDEFIDVTALPGGGFAVAWLTDADEDGDGEGFAIQNYLADGSKDGGPTVLQGVSDTLGQNGDLVSSYDVATLADGGHVLTYAIERATDVKLVTVAGNAIGAGTSVGFGGVPTTITVNSAPAGAVFRLLGTDTGGNAVNVLLTVAAGQIHVPKAVLDTLADPNRATLQVSGLMQGQSAALLVESAQAVRYDTAASTAEVDLAGVVLSSNPSFKLGVLGSNEGRIEGFHLDAPAVFNTLPSAPKLFQMLISVPFDANAINLSGVVGTGGVVSAAVNPLNQLVLIYTSQAQTDFLVPQAILDQIGERDFNAILLGIGLDNTTASFSGSVDVRAEIAIPEGVFVQTFDVDGLATSTGDVPISNLPYDAAADSDIPLDISSLADGSFAVHWLTDADDDGEGETMAVQRFDASGAAVGATVVLQGLADNLLENSENLEHLDVAALDGGGFALSFTLERETVSKALNFSGNPTGTPIIAGFGGIPAVIYVAQAPANAVFKLQGLDAQGNAVTTGALPVVDGQIIISQAMMGQFANPNRVSLEVSGLQQGQTANLFAEIEQSVRYDAVGSLTSTSLPGSVVVVAGGLNVGVLATPEGRVESFHLDAPAVFTTNAGLPKNFQLYLTGPFDPNTISLSGVVGTGGVTQADVSQLGQIVLTFTNLAQTDFAVPPSILAQIGERDFSALLLALGLETGASFSGAADVRAGIAIPEGVFVQTFDASGAATSAGDVRIDGDGNWLPQSEDEDHLDIAPLAGGGFVVNWLADIDDDGEADTAAIQRFDASGNAVGDVVVLDPLPAFIQTDYISGFEVGALADGSYVVSYAMERDTSTKPMYFLGNPGGTPINAGFGGVPSVIVVAQAPANAVFKLIGPDALGNPVSVDLAIADGKIIITEAILSQFGAPNRVSLQVSGLVTGQTANLFAEIEQAVRYDTTSGLTPVDVTGQVVAIPSGINVGVLSTPEGRGEAFHLDAPAAFASGTGIYQLFLSLAFDPNMIDLTGVVGTGGVTATALGSTGQIVLTFGNQAQTDFLVPQTILDQIGERDFGAVLVSVDVVGGSTVTGSVDVREGIAIPEGVFVQTFDADGNPITADLDLASVSDNDVLVGDFGNDTLAALGEANLLTGNAGSDTFSFAATATGLNAITDFTPGSDVIDLSGIDAILGTAEDDMFSFLGTDAFNGSAGQLRYDVTAGNVVMSLDVDGDMVADYMISLHGVTTINPEDIVL